MENAAPKEHFANITEIASVGTVVAAAAALLLVLRPSVPSLSLVAPAPPQKVHDLHMQKLQSYALSDAEHQASQISVVESPLFGDEHACGGGLPEAAQ